VATTALVDRAFGGDDLAELLHSSLEIEHRNRPKRRVIRNAHRDGDVQDAVGADPRMKNDAVHDRSSQLRHFRIHPCT
jgi:hypothetical protein